jgi:mannose-6-phosphate isomerase-like protein (cupin superfamily)
MATVVVSEEEMEQRVVRFKSLTPRPKPVPDDAPQELTDFMTADENYSYMAPAMTSQSVIQKYAAMTGGDAGDSISVSLAVCSPGRGPALHAHLNTVEAFFCLSGRFAIEWGERGEQSVTLEPWDFIHVPKGIVRTFRNIGDQEGALLVIIQGNRNEFDDVVNPPYVAQQIVERFGEGVLRSFEASGRVFGEPIR